MEAAGFLPRQRLDQLLELLRGSGYRIIAPCLREGAVIYDEIKQASDLPAGVAIQVRPGEVRVSHGDSPRQFAWANGPQALKPLLFKPVEPLWQVTRDTAGHLAFTACEEAVQPTAVLGVRACDLAALQLQDQHFLHGEYRDSHYARNRSALLLIAVNCTRPAATCFCAATGDGPEVRHGYDLLLDELDDGFLLTPGSEQGERFVAQLALPGVRPDQQDAARAEQLDARVGQSRSLPSGDLYDDLFARATHPRWSEVAERCLACGNCTQVCPTCFCSREVDETPLHGAASRHIREWDSCFTEGHSYIHGLVVRREIRQRYRQWLTHKLGSWHRQYGRSGCVGCGRCIAWCPVGIDIRVEAGAILRGAPHD